MTESLSPYERNIMNKIIAAAVIALAFTTGFTCSKNAPPQATPETMPPAQEEMTAPTTPPDAAAPAAETAPAAPATK